ncbi:MAG: hypothetical protein IT392_11525 [Nitrospirae bacterium]|nr:hypothetical protein [Nitrospirota bacterium]
MNNTVVVSFENQEIRVIYATSKKGGLFVRDAITLNDAQFEEFLRSEKTKEFIVAGNFRETYQDTITVPFVKKKYLDKIIKFEIQKKCPFKDFSYIYYLSGEKIVENRKTLEIFVLAVRNNEVMNLITRFTNMGKKVTAVYPDIFALARMTRTDGKYGLSVSGAGHNKNLFLVRDGRIVLVREANSPEADMTDYDMRNIEMTANYCRQTLRINPSFIILTGTLSGNFNVSVDNSLPVICMIPPPEIHMDNRIFLEYMTAVSALCADKGCDIAPLSYKNLTFLMQFLRYSTAAFFCLAILSVIYTAIVVMSILPLREGFQNAVRDMPEIDRILSTYENEMSGFTKYSTLISSFERSMEKPDILDLLNAFARIRGGRIRVDSLDISSDEGVLHCKIEGRAFTENYAEAGRAYEKFIGSLADIQGLSVTKNIFELKDKKLFVEADYR